MSSSRRKNAVITVPAIFLVMLIIIACEDPAAPIVNAGRLIEPMFSTSGIPEGPLIFACWTGGQEGDTAFFRVTANGGTLLTEELEPSPDPHEVTIALPHVPGYQGQCAVPWVQGSAPFDPDPTTVTVTQIGTTGLETDSIKVDQPATTGTTFQTPPDTVVTLSMTASNPLAAAFYSNSVGTTPQPVPALPPDEFPSFLYDDSVMVTDSLGGRYSRNVLAVHFNLGTSQAERQSGLAAINGTVIGGAVLHEDGYYLVRVPGGNLAAVDAAIATLLSLPSVMSAMRIVEPLPPLTAHLRPDDGAGWAVPDWTPRVSDAAGTNWNLEMAAFPLAWGCSTGDSLVPVGVIDRTIAVQNVADLAANLDAANSVALNSHLGQLEHGAMVMSVLAAEGDNGQGIAGGMWRARVSGYEVGTDIAGMPITDPVTGAPRQTQFSLAWRLLDAWRNGARVVNISLAQPDTAAISARDTTRVMRRVQPLIDVLTRYPEIPLVVIAAGNIEDPNHPNDAFWSGYPIAADSAPGQVLVVASHDISGQLAASSRRGALVDVAAGGENVTVLDATGQRTQVSGASFAAPLVTALGGLLFSFDTTLTPQEARDLIVQGAGRDGRTAGGIPIVHAYETLKLAAGRMGAPLCGNRVWATGPTIFAERDIGDDSLATASADITSLETFHGGRRVDYSTSGELRTLYWSATGWNDTTRAFDDTTHTVTGATWSRFGLAHDLDSLAKIQQVDFNPPPITARLYSQSSDGFGNPSGPQRTVTTFSGFVPNYFGSDPVNEVGYSPLYGRAYVPVRSGGSMTDPLTVYETDLVTGQSNAVFMLPVAWGLISVSLAEDETELVVNYALTSGGDCQITYVPLVPYARPQRTINIGNSGPICTLRGTFGAPVAQGEGR